MKNKSNQLRNFYILWSTQSLSHLGSAITSFALTLWLYEKTGSALGTAALTICTYAPYVIMSIFAGAITDRFDKKKTMLVCDALAALTTVLVFVLYRTNALSGWHLYGINAFSGLMNTVQQPASEVTYTLVIPRKYDQKTSGLQSLSRSLISIGNPLIASALYGFGGLDAVIAIDLITFAIAFLSPLCHDSASKDPIGHDSGEKCAPSGKGGPAVFKKESPNTVCHSVYVRRQFDRVCI